MKDQHIENEVMLDINIENPDLNSKVSSSTKLERRRRIEELSEERRLREELTEY